MLQEKTGHVEQKSNRAGLHAGEMATDCTDQTCSQSQINPTDVQKQMRSVQVWKLQTIHTRRQDLLASPPYPN